VRWCVRACTATGTLVHHEQTVCSGVCGPCVAAATPAEVTATCDVVFAMLADPKVGAPLL